MVPAGLCLCGCVSDVKRIGVYSNVISVECDAGVWVRGQQRQTEITFPYSPSKLHSHFEMIYLSFIANCLKILG